MRTIKYRAWIPKLGHQKEYPKVGFMFHWDLRQSDCNGCQEGLNNDTVMQFTGLKDKRGFDIYEGDILDKEPGKANHAAGIFYIKWHGAGFGIFKDGKYLGWLGKDVVEFSEIIGNIYEGYNKPVSAG